MRTSGRRRASRFPRSTSAPSCSSSPTAGWRRRSPPCRPGSARAAMRWRRRSRTTCDGSSWTRRRRTPGTTRACRSSWTPSSCNASRRRWTTRRTWPKSPPCRNGSSVRRPGRTILRGSTAGRCGRCSTIWETCRRRRRGSARRHRRTMTPGRRRPPPRPWGLPEPGPGPLPSGPPPPGPPPPGRGTRERGTRERGTRERGTRERGTRERGTRERGTRERGTGATPGSGPPRKPANGRRRRSRSTAPFAA